MHRPKRSDTFTRRDFLNLATTLGWSTALAAFLEACSPPIMQPTVVPPTWTETPFRPSPPSTSMAPTSTSTATSTATPTTPATSLDGSGRIVLVNTRDRVGGLEQALDLLEMNSVRGKTVFLKPNLNSADPPPGSTDTGMLRSLINRLQAMGADRIRVGDRSGMGDTRQVMHNKGILQMADELGCEALVLDELAREDWEMFNPAGSHWQNGFGMARPILDADAIVQTCCLKTHRFGGHFTLSLKNSVGMVARRMPGNSHDYMRELHGSAHQRRMIAEINAAYEPDLVILDGVEAFVDGGPDQGRRVDAQVILAGTDRVAMDAVGVAILRYFGTTAQVQRGRIFEQDQISRAVGLGLGVDRPERIELVTGDSDSRQYADRIQDILLAG